MKTILYKEGCDPFTVTSQEQLDYHLNQGWATEAVKGAKPAASPADTGKSDDKALKAEIKLLKDQLAAATAVPSVDERIKELEEIVVAKDTQITDMQADFEELTKQMSAQITDLKDQLGKKK